MQSFLIPGFVSVDVPVEFIVLEDLSINKYVSISVCLLM